MPTPVERLLEHFLQKVVHQGNGTVRTASGHEFSIGDGVGTPIKITFASPAAQRRLVRDPEMALGEIYMDGLLEVDGGDIYDLHLVVLTNMMAGKVASSVVQPTFATRFLLAPFMRLVQRRGNTRKKARKNAAHHYDLDGRLYDLFLDKDMQYSCAYFESETATLEDAQLAKKRHIAAKLNITPG